jgi:ribosomal protein S1
LVPACLTNEPGDECSARIADINQERHRMDLTLRRVQDSLATQGIVVSERYTMSAKYLVAATCWEGM